MAARLSVRRRIAEMPWTPARQWWGNLILAPLALLFGLYWGARKLVQHASGVFGLLLLVVVVFGLNRIDLFDGVDPWMVFSLAALGGLISSLILVDWYRDKLRYSSLFAGREDPRHDIARRRFHLVCEQASFSPSAWHAGHDNDMYGIGVELYLRRLLIWKHGRAYLIPLDDCEFAHGGDNLYVKVKSTSPEGAGETMQFRVSCTGGQRSPREWVKLLKRASRRKL